mgnify:CR=1 FL=1
MNKEHIYGEIKGGPGIGNSNMLENPYISFNNKETYRSKNNSEKRSIDIQNILIDVIPNSRRDFGSFRGYATFGYQIHKDIIKDFTKKYAQTHRSKRIRDNFIKDWIVDRLYRFPDGLRVQKLKKEFYDNA